MIESLYFPLERAILLIHNGAAATVQGLALGILSNDQLERLTQQRYLKESVSNTSCASEAYLNSGLSIWERVAIFRYFPNGGNVLVAAAGAGREMLALAEAGFRVDGFDCCAPLVEMGRNEFKSQGVDANIQHAPPSDVPDGLRSYDAVLVGFSGYMYIPSRMRRISFLRKLSKLLKPNSPLMISFTEGTYGRRRTWTAKIGTAIRKLRGAEPVEEGDTLKDGFQHHFLPEQVASEFDEAGLDLEYYSGGTCYGSAVGIVRQGN